MTEEHILLEDARNGDLNAFRRIFDLNKERVYRAAYDMLGAREDAEDVSQEVFLKAYRSVGQFRGESKVSTWLYRITMNACHDHMSRKAYRTTKPSDTLERSDGSDPLFHSGAGVSPGRKAEAAVIGEHIERALGTLTPRERSVFVLRHYEELSMKEIADVLKITDGTVRSILFRALKRLQQELSHYRADLGLEESQ